MLRHLHVTLQKQNKMIQHPPFEQLSIKTMT